MARVNACPSGSVGCFGLRLAREKQVNVRVRPTGEAIDAAEASLSTSPVMD
jgi:hypothetical protein